MQSALNFSFRVQAMEKRHNEKKQATPKDKSK